MSTEHPIRNAEVHTFERKDVGEGTALWLARLYPYNTYPIFFQGHSEDDVVAQAESLRAEAISKYEKAYITKQEAKLKRKETLIKKKEKTND
tara:strand:+ start:1231 stop:1506 length:276 start_codon:yes stop_codon:yes gene_type:complete